MQLRRPAEAGGRPQQGGDNLQRTQQVINECDTRLGRLGLEKQGFGAALMENRLGIHGVERISLRLPEPRLSCVMIHPSSCLDAVCIVGLHIEVDSLADCKGNSLKNSFMSG